MKSFDEAVQVLLAECKKKHDFIDAILFSKTNGTIIVGNLSDKKVGKVRHYSRAIDNWYYLDAKKNLGKTVMQTVPIRDYLFRYERGGFWVGKYAYELFGVPFNRLTRFLLNPLMHTRKMYEALQVSGASQQFLIQDMGVPSERAVEFLHFIDKEIDIYPLWLCPLKTVDDSSNFQTHQISKEMCINVGVWGNRIENYNEFIRLNRILEQQLTKLGGKKWFYAHSYYLEKEFWQIYDKKAYDAVRKKYHAEHLPSVFDKVVVKKHFPVDFHKGVLRAIFGKAKLKIQ